MTWRRHLPVVALLTATAVLYLWDLDGSGWANSYYAGAVQAGAESWPAFFFGGLDAGGYITIDKPPLALWPMVLSSRLFGLSPWTLLVPQALEGIAAVGVLYATVRRATGSRATALVAGGLLAVTPVAVLMFRYDNPDALLTLLVVLAAYATTRAVERPSSARWLAVAGLATGLAFLTKMLEGWVVLPALALTYLRFADRSPARRLRDLVMAGAVCVASAGWWVAIAQLWPASSRPWIGGSETNSVLELTLGYNGVGRIIGSSGTSPGIQGGWGATNLARIGRTDLGAEIAWLVPAAVVLGVVALLAVRRQPDRRSEEIALTMWLSWLAVTSAVFLAMTGIFHSYYVVIQAPAIAALLAIGGHVVVRDIGRRRARHLLIGCTIVTGIVAIAVLAVEPKAMRPWMVLVVGTALAAVVVLASRAGRHGRRVTIGLVLASALIGPLSVDLATVASPHVGSAPMAGPATAPGPGDPFASSVPGTVPEGLVHLLGSHSRSRWAAATEGARMATAMELASGTSVMGLGGYNGSDPSPTLAEFQQYVAQGDISYYIATTFLSRSAIHFWVTTTFPSTVVDGVTVYDLGPTSGVRVQSGS